ncbi:MAG: type II toxin-antitoxin system RelE/ParE family toxin [Bacteroidaceae bacterium]|nr:type II toxin-antitoxin system RelE/ParE family toxin [Bacteroidaceae bacterium]
MKSILTNLAKQQIRQTAKYIRREFGIKTSQEFIQKVYQTRCLIEEHPNIGSVEPLLAERTVMHRSCVVNRLNKMVYRIKDDNIIEIVAFWDVRRDPGMLANQV